AIAARNGGASRVYVSDVVPDRLALLEGMDDVVPVDASAEDLGERVRHDTTGWGPSAGFEASGAQPAYDSLWELPAPGGVVVLVGIPAEPVKLDVSTAQSRGTRIETVFRYANVYQKAIDL